MKRMLLFKITKLENVAFLSLLDYRRCIMRTINRAKLKYKLSLGYNPHENIYFTPPIPLGIESYCEYVYFDCDENPDFFQNEFNKNAPNGLKILKIKQINEKLNFNDIIKYVKYEIRWNNNLIDYNLNFYLERKSIIKDYKSKEHNKSVDIRPLIYEINEVENGINAYLMFGETTLKPNLFIEDFVNFFNLSDDFIVLKTNIYNVKDKKLIDFDEIFNV